MSTTFDPKRVAIVDKTSSSILIRGNLPLIDGKYAYSKIGTALGLDLGQYQQFLSISLIDNTGERDVWAQELQAFGVSPDLFLSKNWPPYLHQPNWDPSKKLGTQLNKSVAGSIIWWPIEGLPEGTDPTVFLKSPGWDLTGLVNLTASLLKEPKTAIYFHCMLGADRTGALHAGYLIRHKGLGIEEALSVTSKATVAGAPTMDYQRLARAYAA